MIVDKSNTKHCVWGEICDGWHLLEMDNLSVIRENVPPGISETRPFHKKAHQFFYILSGKATIEIEDKIFELEPGHRVSRSFQNPHTSSQIMAAKRLSFLWSHRQKAMEID